MAEQKKLKVSSLLDIKKQASGKLVEFSGWDDDIPFVARVKKVSMMNLVVEGVIPNSLLGAAEQVFNGKASSKKAPSMEETSKIFRVVAKSCLVEPSYEDLENAEIDLTDAQLVEIFNYAQLGVKGLERFRADQERVTNNNPSGKVPQDSKSNTGNNK